MERAEASDSGICSKSPRRSSSSTDILNRAVSFPCALSTFVACPSTPAGNRFPFRVEAGEFTPPTPHERISTYKG